MQIQDTLYRALDQIQGTIADFIAALPTFLIGLLVLLFFIWLSGFARDRTISLLKRVKQMSQGLANLFARLVRGFVIGLGALIALTIAFPGFSVAEVVQILGVGSVAIGFAFRDIFENFLSGVLILLQRPFRIGDEIISGDYEGRVEDIEIRATYLRTYDGRAVVIPNSDLYTSAVVVNTAYKYRRNQYDIGIGYEDDIARAQEIMMEVMTNTEGVIDSPAPDTIMMEMGDSAIIIRVRWWSKPQIKEFWQVQDRVLRGIKNRLTEEGFNIPFPIRTVMFYDQSVNGIDGESVDQQAVSRSRRSERGSDGGNG